MWLRATFAAAAVVFFHLVTVWLIATFLPADGLVLLPGVELRVVENPRGPFGVGPAAAAAVIGVLILLLLGWQQALDGHYLARTSPFLTGCLFGGGLVNSGERLLRGVTTDILVLGQITAINIADLAILTGIVGFLFVALADYLIEARPRAG